MAEVAITGFAPGSKYATISRDFYRELLNDLDRIKTAQNIDDARAHTNFLYDKLKKKYEPSSNTAEKLRQSDTKLGQ